jgi:hypothetical protein
MVRDALSALILMKAGRSREVGSNDGSGIFAAFHSSCNVARDEVIRFASWVSSEGDVITLVSSKLKIAWRGSLSF